MPKKVCIYTRVSDASQLQGSGLDGQESTCRERATRNEMEVDRVFSDGGFSGSLRSRPDLDKMIQYLEEKNKKFTTIELVIVDDFDRIVRDVQGWREIKLRIEGAGAKIFSLKQDLNDTPEGKMLQSITMATKQYERENNGRRVSDRQIARLKAGYRTFKQFPGYMYMKDPAKGGQILVAKQPDFDHIKEALTLFGDGVIVNATALQKFLNDRGVLSVKGCKIHLSLAQRLLTPRFLDHYLGLITHEPRDIIKIPGKHPKMLTESIVEKIIDRINPKKCYKEFSPGEISEQLPLRSVLKCEVCGHPLTGAPSKNKLGNTYYYYTCRDRRKCSLYGKSFWNKKVHESLETYLSSLSLDDGRYDLCRYQFQQIWDNRKSLAETKILSKKKRFEEIGVELERVQARIFKTDDDTLIAMYEKKLKELSDEQDALTFSISAFDSEVEGVNPVQTLERGKKYLEDPRLVRQNGSLEVRRLFIKALVGEKFHYNRKDGVRTLEKPSLYKDTGMLYGQNSNMVGDIGLEPMTPCL